MRILGVVSLAWITIHPALAADWPYWRGPNQNGAALEEAAVTSWDQGGEGLLWKFDEGGRTTPIILDNRLFAILPVGEGPTRGERIVALDAVTGRKLWEKRFNVFHTDIVENRVGWTALAGDPDSGRIYAHATGGEFFCLTRDGDEVWKISMTEELGRISGYGGRLHTPILDEDRVVVSYLNSSWGNLARPLHRYVAFHKGSGDIQWWAAPGGQPLDTTYSTPVTAVMGGRRMLVAATADGNAYGMLARNGEKRWTFRLSKRGLNASVVVDGDRAYLSHSEENLHASRMGSIVCIDGTGTGDITESGVAWRRDGHTFGYASPAVANGRLYAVDNSANLFCMDAASGKIHWEYNMGRVGKGSPVVTSDGVIYVGEQNGIFHILRDEGTRCVSLDKEVFERPDGTVDEIFGSPAVVNGRVYFMTRYGIYCLGKPDQQVKTLEAPPAPRETARPEPGSKDSLRVVPAEATLGPGEQIRLKALRFDSVGSAPSPASVKWSVSGVSGTIVPDGTFTASNRQAFSGGLVTAKTAAGGSAAARIRIAPDLPIDEDFESLAAGSVPPGWVGVASKTQVFETEGQVLKKLASKARPSPPFMRLRAYATPPIAGGYTVEVDLLGKLARKRFKPDMGLINSRYRFIMMGMRKRLRIETWSPLPRLRHDVAFPWEPEVWYRAKFSVLLEGDQARVRAKVWPREEPEPAAWSIEVLDPHPNREGSAGLYGYSVGTTSKSDGPEILFDNFKVVKNDD